MAECVAIAFNGTPTGNKFVVIVNRMSMEFANKLGDHMLIKSLLYELQPFQALNTETCSFNYHFMVSFRPSSKHVTYFQRPSIPMQEAILSGTTITTKQGKTSYQQKRCHLSCTPHCGCVSCPSP
eukprot:scaffold35967_cov15-Tisochrysis_lutea.AAC.1